MATIGPPLQTPEIDLIEAEAMEVVLAEDDDEGMEIDLDEEELERGFSDNIVDDLEDDVIAQIASSVVENFENDLSSRKEWARAYVNGLDLLGLQVEKREEPWKGASGVFHPVLTESIIRFQAQAMGEIFPASGPVRSKILGKLDGKKEDQAKRIEREMNYQLTENMEEYRDETEQKLFHLPMAGSAFKKAFYDPVTERPSSMFVPAEDVVVSYGATNLMTAQRFTHVMRKTREEVEELMDIGFYRDISLGDPVEWRSDIQKKYDDVSGEEPSYTDDSRFVLLEQHVMMKIEDEEGIARPYVVTVDKSSGELLSVRRNWRESDPKRRRRMHFIHYKYLPGMGFYGIGLIHLLGGLSKTATSVLRQLIDAGTLSNLPAGFKARGMRNKGDDSAFQPGEFRDIDVPGTRIQDSIMPLPFKEPSATLYNLLGSIVDEARRIGAVAETEITQFSKEMPVGTAFAILERQLKVMSGVQARLHAAQKRELKILSHIIHDYMGPDYDWDEEGEFNRKEDFDGRVDVIPVSDPNAATVAQRVTSHQAAMQMASQAPQLYNMGKLHRQMLEILQIDNAEEIVKLPDDIKAMDPVTENMAILKQEPVKAFMYQDHEAHIGVHLAMAQDPKVQQLVGQSPFAEAIMSAMSSHITEHVAFQYRKEIEKNLGVSMPSPDEPMPEDVELEVSRLTAQAAQKLLSANQAEVAQQEAQKKAEDPITQMQMRELDLKERKQEHEENVSLMEIELEAFKHGMNMGHMRERLNSEEVRAVLNASVKMALEPNKDEKMVLDALRTALGILREAEQKTLEN